jgi:hypothetical protein
MLVFDRQSVLLKLSDSLPSLAMRDYPSAFLTTQLNLNQAVTGANGPSGSGWC